MPDEMKKLGILIVVIAALVCIAPATAYTTELNITKLANDGTTVLAQQTVDYDWMMNNLPVLGDGVTHYYHQGPVFVDDPDPEVEELLRLNPEEDTNVYEKDMGAVMGTNLKDLCDLVGGMNAGEEVLVKASDGLSRPFAYENVYEYSSREGPMVITWYCDGLSYPGTYPDTGYSDGMRLVWLADDSINPFGIHAFGNYDWSLAASEDYWYYYVSGSESYPTTTGLSVKYISDIIVLSDDPAPTMDVLYDGPVTLTPGATFDVVAYNSGVTYTVGETTPLGALQATGLDYDVTDKNYATSGALLLDNVDVYLRDKTNGTYWYAYVNDEYKDGYNNPAGGLNLVELADGDTVEFYYAADVGDPTDLAAVQAAATAAVKTVADIQTGPVMDVLYDGPVTLTPGETFDMVAYNSGLTYTINRTTPLGALDIAATSAGFTYDVTDKRYEYDQVLLLDNVDDYLRKSPGYWYAYVNDEYKDGYMNTPDGLNVIELADGDTVEFYYAADVGDPTDLAAVQAAATAAVKTVADIQTGPVMDVLYDGPVTLTPGETFDVVAYNSGVTYTINRTTPLGALDVAATAGGFTYDATDKRYEYDQVLLLDNVDDYLRKSPGYWYAYVNDEYKDGYMNTPDGMNVIELEDGDTVEFYYAADVADPADLAAVQAIATAAVKTVAEIPPPYDILYKGTVVLSPDETFDVVAYNSGVTYTVNYTTPLGALDIAATSAGFTYDVTDKRYEYDQVLLLDNVDGYLRKSPGYWYAYVNDVYKDGYMNTPDGLNVFEVVDGDAVEFYYAADVADPADLMEVEGKATAAVLTVVATGVTPDTWTLEFSGAMDTTVSKDYFEAGLACVHYVEWTDLDGNTWGGIPLWLLVALVDDNPDVGPDHFNFNDDIAAQGYTVKVIAGDGWDTSLASADIARNDGYIVANTLNGEELPMLTEGGKPCWPLHLKGPEVFGGQQVGNIVRIELVGLPEPPEGWALEMVGEVGDTITQSEFEDGIACVHGVEWTDDNGDTWSGVPLWVLLGAVDDIELASHWTFNDDVATAGYTVNVIADDGYTRTFTSADVARNDGYIVANKKNAVELDADSGYPLKLNGPAITSGKDRVGNIAIIEIPELQTPPAGPGSWNLNVSGKITDVISQAEFQAALDCPASGHYVEWTDIDGNVWSGLPLWFLCGWVDDRLPHEFSATQAMAGYKITVMADDGYAKEFASADVAWSGDYIVANRVNGEPLGDSWPLRLVGDGVTRADGTLGGMSVGNIADIILTEFNEPTEIPKLHIVKYGEDQQTIVAEVWIDYTEMMTQFEVIGDGETVYSYQGVTFDPEDIWGEYDETKGGTKISNAVKGTKLSDLVGLVGGMGEETELILVASDGRKQALPYSSIYPTPEIYEHQGHAILAWYADGAFVPGYSDGMRNFFMPEDHIFGQWDMHEAMPPSHWHYYYQSYPPGDPNYPGILFPSCAGTSNKYVTELFVYTVAETPWNLQLDGTGIGGIEYTISKGYFESALTCQFGANHEASYIDSKGNVWTGMPLFFLAGFVDDADQHSNEAYNETLALQGYDIIVSAPDGYSRTFKSIDTIRSSGFIVANSLNGFHISEDDSSWPLRLVGENVAKSDNVKGISRITLNFPPDVSGAYPSMETLWPANNKYVDVTIMGVNDPFDDAVTVTITGITSDEPTDTGGKKHTPDADPDCIGTDTAILRAERLGNGNGRVYEITFIATDSVGGQAEGTVTVSVPHDQGQGSEAIDDGQLYDATQVN